MNRSVLMTVARPDGTGAHRMAHSFALAFREAGFRAGLVLGRLLDPHHLPVSAEVMVQELRDRDVSVCFEDGFAANWSPRLVRTIAQRARAQGADAVVAFQQRDRKFAIWAARKAGLPAVVSVQNQHTFHGMPLTRWLKQAVYSRVIRQARLLVCTSTVVQREMIDRFGVAHERTALLPNGIDLGRFALASRSVPRLWSQLGVAPDEILIANLGRLDRQKGQDLLVEAFGRLASRFPRLRLGLIGSASAVGAGYARALGTQVARLGLSQRVVFAGWRDDVPQLLADADFYVHTARWEGSPLALLEAMASRLPVAYTDGSGRLEGFTDGVHGWTIESGNVSDMVGAIGRIASLDEAERRRMGLEARLLVEQRHDVVQRIAPRFVELVIGALTPGELSRAGR